MQKLFVSSLQFMAVALAIGLLVPTDVSAQSSSRSGALTGSGIRTVAPQQSYQSAPSALQGTIISQPAGSGSRVEMPSVMGSPIAGSSDMMSGEVIVSDPMTTSAPMTSYAAPMESYSAAPMASSSACCGQAAPAPVTYSAPVECCPTPARRRGLFRNRR